MEAKNNFKLKVKIKSFYNAWTKCCRPEKKTNKLNKLKSIAVIAGWFTIVYSTMIFLTAFQVYKDYDSKSDNSTSSASLNQTQTENSTTSHIEKQNLRNSTTDGDLPKQPLGFPVICGIFLYVHLINSSFMFLYGALMEYKHLLLPWMISAPTSMIGFFFSIYFYPYLGKTFGFAIFWQIYGVFVILLIMGHFFYMIEYYGLLAERDRAKRTIDNLRPIPTVLPGETEC